MFCPVCKAEYRDGYSHCSDCNVDLVYSLPENENNDEDTDRIEDNTSENTTFVPILYIHTISDITALRSILDNQGIEYYLQGENTAYTFGGGPIILKVRQDQAGTVKELLKDFNVNLPTLGTK